MDGWGVFHTTCSGADGIPPDGSNILLVHNSTCKHTVAGVSLTHGEGRKGGWCWEWRSEREMDGGIRGEGHEAVRRSFWSPVSVMELPLFLFVYIPHIPSGIMDDYLGH